MQMTSKIKKQNLWKISSKMSTYFQDESSIEKDKKMWRIIVRRWEKARIRGYEQLHNGTHIFGVYRTDWKFTYITRKRKKKEDFWVFLKYVRKKDDKKRIVMIVDNAMIHRNKEILNWCKENYIVLVYMPPYSPDLNKIEFQWKSIKKMFWKIQWNYNNIKKAVRVTIIRVRKNMKEINLEKMIYS